MKREIGLAYCGLACCVCDKNDTCVGCRNEGCTGREWCLHYNCCREKGLNGCWECDEFPCDKNQNGFNMHKKKYRALAFAEFIQEHGEDAMLDCLARNEAAGIVYHYPGTLDGDYDKCATGEQVKHMLATGEMSE